MYNIAISFVAGALVFLLSSLWLGPLPSVLPALIAVTVLMFVLSRRTGKLVEAEIQKVVPLLQARKIKEAQDHLQSVKQKYGKWQVLLEGQLDAQLGMIDYLQLKFDKALPKLENGKFRNWTALTAIGCIHWRNKQKTEAYENLSAAASTAPSEAIIYVVWATLLNRDGLRADALTALDQGLKELPDSTLLKGLRKKIANKKKLNTKQYPEVWHQFFPEELAQQMLMRGRRDGPTQPVQQQRFRAPRR